MVSSKAAILVVDDDPAISKLLSRDLSKESYCCVVAATGEEALKRLRDECFNAVLLDLGLPGISGMDVLREMQSICPETAAIIITGATDAPSAVEAMKIGAFDYITKPFDLDKVNQCVKTALNVKSSRRGNAFAAKEDNEAEWAHCMEDIAHGVRDRLDLLNGHLMTRIIVEKTVAIAQSMEIPESQIQKWAADELGRIERKGILDSLLHQPGISAAT